MDPSKLTHCGWLLLISSFLLVLGPENLGQNMNLQNQQVNTPSPYTSSWSRNPDK